MSTISGLEAAAKGLDDDSLVRAEVELLIERLRLGMTEEQALLISDHLPLWAEFSAYEVPRVDSVANRGTRIIR